MANDKADNLKKKRDATLSTGNSIVISGDNVQIVGDNNRIVGKFLTQYFQTNKEDNAQRNRRIMLAHVENFWVKGVLDRSLHGAALLELGIKQDPTAVEYPLQIQPPTANEDVPAGTSMLEVFEQIGLGRSLLILGAPGAGKTTMLLELARQLIERARNNIFEPIPVVFNLSSWTENYSLAQWLARELNHIYSVPNKAAPLWINENRLLLLLDGLDEVPHQIRSKCIKAVNRFRMEYALTSIVVCSRREEYFESTQKLAFDGAVEIQPLTTSQVKAYFKLFGKELAGVQKTLERDKVLGEMARTPLLLSIIAMAYRDAEISNISGHANANEEQKHLLDMYVERMFAPVSRSINATFSRQNIQQWLSWLASMMMDRNEFAFSVETIQPTWLVEKKQKVLYRIIVGLIVAFITGLSFWITIHLGFGSKIALPTTLTIALITGIIGGLVGGLKNKIDIVDILSWNYKKAFIGLIGGLLLVLVSLSAFGMSGNLIFKIIAVMLIGLATGLEPKQSDKIVHPGQKLWLSGKNGLLASSLLWVSGTLLFGPIGGLIGALVGGLFFGVLALVQHYALRFVLLSRNLLPWNLIPFLNYCVDRIFLRRVGGGYIFVHRLLMEYFAAMYKEKSAPSPRNKAGRLLP